MNYILFTTGKEYQLKGEVSVQLDIKLPQDIILGPICLHKSGLLVISSWYAWDGPSGPTKYISAILRIIPIVGVSLWWLFIRSFIRGSLIHDALYQLIRNNLLDPELRDWVDRELIRICKEDKMSSIRRKWIYRGLQVGGGSSIRPENKQKIYRAPI